MLHPGGYSHPRGAPGQPDRSSVGAGELDVDFTRRVFVEREPLTTKNEHSPCDLYNAASYVVADFHKERHPAISVPRVEAPYAANTNQSQQTRWDAVRTERNCRATR